MPTDRLRSTRAVGHQRFGDPPSLPVRHLALLGSPNAVRYRGPCHEPDAASADVVPLAGTEPWREKLTQPPIPTTPPHGAPRFPLSVTDAPASPSRTRKIPSSRPTARALALLPNTAKANEYLDTADGQITTTQADR